MKEETMNKWEKPVLSVLGVDKTKGGNVLTILSGVPSFDNEDLFTTQDVEGAQTTGNGSTGSTASTGSESSVSNHS